MQHPDWCDLAECDEPAGHADIRHASTPIVWRAASDDVEVSLASYLDVQRDGSGSPAAKVALGLRAAGPYGADEPAMVVVLTEADVDRLVRDLARLRGLGPGGRRAE